MPETSLDRSTVAKTVAGFLAAAALLYLFGRVIGWGEILRTLRDADLRWFALACLSALAYMTIWSQAWNVILRVVDVEIPFSHIVVTYYAATFADYVTPFGKAGGSPFVAYVLSQDERANYQDSLAGVVTADTLNLVPFFVFAGVGAVGLLVTGGLANRADPLIGGLVALAVAIPVAGAVVWHQRGRVESFSTTLAGPLAARTDIFSAEGLSERIREFYRLLDRIAATPRRVAYTLVFSFVGWVFFALPLYLAGLTLGYHLDPLVVLFAVPASSLASIVPTPGGLGGVEAALVGLLVALTPITPGTAAGIALVYRVASYWFALGVGGIAALYVVYRS